MHPVSKMKPLNLSIVVFSFKICLGCSPRWCCASLHCHKMGLWIIFYLNDTIIMAQSYKVALQHYNFVVKLLDQLGSILKKSGKVFPHPCNFVYIPQTCWWHFFWHCCPHMQRKAWLPSVSCSLLSKGQMTCHVIVSWAVPTLQGWRFYVLVTFHVQFSHMLLSSIQMSLSFFQVLPMP